MPAYFRSTFQEFLDTEPDTISAALHSGYVRDGFQSQYTTQTSAWDKAIGLLQEEIGRVVERIPASSEWGLLLEYPLYRLKRRVDLIVLAGDVIVATEMKVGADRFLSMDRRQAEEYGLDLRDFHSDSAGRLIVPVLWITGSDSGTWSSDVDGPVSEVQRLGRHELAPFLISLSRDGDGAQIDVARWDESAYEPVPNIIEAATSIFRGHNVRDIARADASNLDEAAYRVVELIGEARRTRSKRLIFLTGVPGAGKTLAGLQAVHDAVATGADDEGDIVYLSGNTPLVVVLREALAQDEHSRSDRTLTEVRRDVRARIQHINDFLKEYLLGSSEPPHEHAVVFDEAQRAWDAAQGEKKFDRPDSEPAILLDLMSRHEDWCALIGLVGGGQEINSGEEGIAGWGDALRQLPDDGRGWEVFGPNEIYHGGPTTGDLDLGRLPNGVIKHVEDDLRLRVPMRTFRSPRLADWVRHVLEGDDAAARALVPELGSYPIVLTRRLSDLKRWLRDQGRGQRRYGLLASSGARRLRAFGLGERLNATDRRKIAYWYLKGRNDVRSSYALEVPANEYTCQGLEIDFAGLCWGADFRWDPSSAAWLYRRFRGNRWTRVKKEGTQRFIQNKYRVMLTRAREGLGIWVPRGTERDHTRKPEYYDGTAEFLLACGAEVLE